jgi:hypothetical protein
MVDGERTGGEGTREAAAAGPGSLGRPPHCRQRRRQGAFRGRGPRLKRCPQLNQAALHPAASAVVGGPLPRLLSATAGEAARSEGATPEQTALPRTTASPPGSCSGPARADGDRWRDPSRSGSQSARRRKGSHRVGEARHQRSECCWGQAQRHWPHWGPGSARPMPPQGAGGTRQGQQPPPSNPASLDWARPVLRPGGDPSGSGCGAGSRWSTSAAGPAKNRGDRPQAIEPWGERDELLPNVLTDTVGWNGCSSNSPLKGGIDARTVTEGRGLGRDGLGSGGPGLAKPHHPGNRCRRRANQHLRGPSPGTRHKLRWEARSEPRPRGPIGTDRRCRLQLLDVPLAMADLDPARMISPC